MDAAQGEVISELHLGYFPEVCTPASTAREFQPMRAEPKGFLVHHLRHSVTLSCETRLCACVDLATQVDAFVFLGGFSNMQPCNAD